MIVFISGQKFSTASQNLIRRKFSRKTVLYQLRYLVPGVKKHGHSQNLSEHWPDSSKRYLVPDWCSSIIQAQAQAQHQVKEKIHGIGISVHISYFSSKLKYITRTKLCWTNSTFSLFTQGPASLDLIFNPKGHSHSSNSHHHQWVTSHYPDSGYHGYHPFWRMFTAQGYHSYHGQCLQRIEVLHSFIIIQLQFFISGINQFQQFLHFVDALHLTFHIIFDSFIFNLRELLSEFWNYKTKKEKFQNQVLFLIIV